MLAAAAEQRRVAAHIARAERAARAELPPLDPLRRRVRRLLRDALEGCRRAGRFPGGPGLAEPTPVFIDAHGTRCAMAHLLELGGEAALAARIARERNLARVRELADESRLWAWLAAAGLTLEEAAAIQPVYCWIKSECICDYYGYPVPAAGVLDGTVVQVDANGAVRMRVDLIYGAGTGYHVGDELGVVLVRGPPSVGNRVLIPIGGPEDLGLPVVDGKYTCRAGYVAKSLTVDQFVAAVTSSDCAQTLAGFDPDWAALPANDVCMPPPQSGCAVSGGSAGDITPFGILLALLAGLVARRNH